MSVKVRWYDEAQAIVLYEFQGDWTWDELYPQYDTAIAMEKSVTHRVDVIIDMRRAGRLPKNVLSHMKNFSDKQPDNIGITAIVTNNAFVRTLYTTGCKFYPKIQRYFTVVQTLDDAERMIAEQTRLATQ